MEQLNTSMVSQWQNKQKAGQKIARNVKGDLRFLSGIQRISKPKVLTNYGVSYLRPISVSHQIKHHGMFSQDHVYNS